VAVEQLVIVVNCMTFFSYSVMVFQLLLELELLAVNKLQLQLELTDAYFSVITGFQLQLVLTGITLRIGACGHFRSRDKDGGHTIRSAISENSMLYANFTTLSFIEPDLLPIEVLHCGNSEFRVFFAKNSGNYYNFFFEPPK